MSVKVDLRQLLEIALATPEVGNVNFNVLRGFLHEVLKHLGIRKKVIYINEDSDDFKTAYDLICDGIIEVRARTPSDLNLIEEHVHKGDVGMLTYSPTVRRGIASDDVVQQLDSSSRRTKSASPRISKELIPSDGNKSDFAINKGAEISLTVTPADSLPSGEGSITPGMGLQKSSPSARRSGESNRGDLLRSLKINIAELQARVESLEAGMGSIAAKSTASMFLHGDSKTPAKDMLEVINIGRKLEASESTIQGLSEMIDALTSDLNGIKEDFAKIHKIDAVSVEIEKLKDSFREFKKNQAPKEEVKQDIIVEETVSEGTSMRLEGMENKIRDLKEELKNFMKHTKSALAKPKSPSRKPSMDMAHIERIIDRKVNHGISQLAQQFSNSNSNAPPPIVMSSEPPKEIYEALDKCDEIQEAQAVLEEHVKDFEVRLESLESKDDVVEETTAPQSSHDFIRDLKQELTNLKKKIDQMSKDATQANSATKRMDVESKQMHSQIMENKLQIPQLENSLTLLKRETEEMNSTLQALLAEKEELKPFQKARSRSIDGSEDISLIRTMIFDLQEEKENLKHANKNVLEDIYQKQKALDELHRQLEMIQIVKADKDLVTNEIRFKADKKDMELKVEREDFDRYIGLVDQSLRDLLQRLEGHENVLREAIEKVSVHIKTKLDKTEVEPLKNFLEERLKAFKPKPVQTRPPEEYAAGFRKVLIKNFSCISCDRPVEFARDGMFPPLPSAQAMPAKKSNRPYTTYELDQVRQHMMRGLDIEQEGFEAIDNRRRKLQSELLKLCGVPNMEDLADVIDRPCGGSHTLSFPHSPSIIRGLHLNKEDCSTETIKSIKTLQNVDIMGQDGHIYKGLVEDVPVLPQIGNKPVSPRSVPQRGIQEETRKSPSHSTTPTSAKGDAGAIDDVDSS